MAALPLGPSPVPGGLTVPGPTQGEVFSRPADQTDAVLAQGFDNLSAQIGALADKAAYQEGTRAGKIAGMDPNFRPQQSVTTTGAATQQAAVTGYVSQLQQTTRDAIQKTYNDFTDLPVDQQTPDELAKRYAQLHGELVQKHVVPELQGQFDTEFQAQVRTNVQLAKTSHDTYIQNSSKASAASDLTSSGNQQSRLAATNDPTADKALTDTFEAYKAKIAALVADQTYTPLQGQKLIETRDQQNKQEAVSARFKALPPDKRAGFVAEFQKDWINGATGKPADPTTPIAIDGYTGTFTRAQAEAAPDDDEKTPSVDEWDEAAKAKGPGGATVTKGMSSDTYDATLGEMQKQLRSDVTQGKEQSRLDVKQIEDATSRVTDGHAVTPAERQALNQKYSTTTDLPTSEAYDSYRRAEGVVANARGKSPAELQAQLNAQRAGPQTGRQVEDNATLQKYTDTLRKDLAADPLGRAVRDEVVKPVAPLDFSDPGKFAASLSARLPTAHTVAEAYHTDMTYFTPDEVSQLKTIATEGGPKMDQMAQAMAKVGGTATGEILKEAGIAGTGMAHLGKLADLGGDGQFRRDVAEAQRLSGTADGKQALEGVNHDKAVQQAGEAYGQAFQAMPDFQAGAIATAKQAYQVQALRDPSLDKKLESTDSLDKFTRSAQLAAGATFDGSTQYGGVADYKHGGFIFGRQSQKVPIPPDMKASEFANVMRSLTDGLLKSLPAPPVGGDHVTPVTAQQIQGGNLVAIGHGRYKVALGDSAPGSPDPQWVLDPSGNPFVLDLNQMAPQLHSLLPGAYRTR